VLEAKKFDSSKLMFSSGKAEAFSNIFDVNAQNIFFYAGKSGK
jgi:hypothetical protein